MTFVKRDAEGMIRAVSTQPEGEGWETVEGDAPELLHFLTEQHGANSLAETDLAVIRVLEDLIDVLVDKGVIRFTDLPAPAQEKLSQRRSVRAAHRRLELLGDEDVM